MSSDFKVYFDGVEITEALRVTDLRRGIFRGLNSRTQSRTNKKGAVFLGTSSTLPVIPMDFTLLNGLVEKRRLIAKTLNVSEPKKLTFSDEPDKYYMAFPTGDIDVAEKRYFGKAQIKWEIPDAVAYSETEYQFKNDGTNAIIVNNPGTEPMQLEMTAEFTSDCGYLGVQGDDGKVKALFGTIAEVNGEDYETSELLFDDHLFSDKGWTLNNGITPPVTSERLQVGTVAYKVDEYNNPVDPNEGFAYPTNYGSGTSWHGPSLTKTIPADKNGAYAKNFKANFRLDFNNGSKANPAAGPNRGHNSLTFVDQNDKIIASVVIEDNNPALEKSDLALYVGDKRVYQDMNTDKYYTTQRPTGSWITVEKLGDRVRFSSALGNLNLEFPCDENTELRKITWYCAAWGNGVAKGIINNNLRALQVVKHNVHNWRDILNKFTAHDKLEYWQDGRHINCLVNDTPFLKYRDPGSTIIKAPPGQSMIYLSWSDFATAPNVTLTGRAMYT